MFSRAKKGDRVVKVLDIHGIATATIETIAKVSKKKMLIYLDADKIDDEGVATYRADNGRCVIDTYPSYTRIIPLVNQ